MNVDKKRVKEGNWILEKKGSSTFKSSLAATLSINF
jgi:hypothetical protein